MAESKEEFNRCQGAPYCNDEPCYGLEWRKYTHCGFHKSKEMKAVDHRFCNVCDGKCILKPSDIKDWCDICNGNHSYNCRTCHGTSFLRKCAECHLTLPLTKYRTSVNVFLYCDECVIRLNIQPCIRCNNYLLECEFRTFRGKRNKRCNDCLEQMKEYASKVEKNCVHGKVRTNCKDCELCPPLNASSCAYCGRWYKRICMYKRTNDGCQCQHCLWCLNDQEENLASKVCKVCDKPLASLLHCFNEGKYRPYHELGGFNRPITENQWSWLEKGRPEQEHYVPSDKFLAYREAKRRKMDK